MLRTVSLSRDTVYPSDFAYSVLSVKVSPHIEGRRQSRKVNSNAVRSTAGIIVIRISFLRFFIVPPSALFLVCRINVGTTG